MATSLVPLILIPQILFSGLVGVPTGVNKVAGLLMPATWSFDTMKRYSTLDTLEEEGAIRGRGLYKNIEAENDKIIAKAKSDLEEYKNETQEKLNDFERDLKSGKNAAAPMLDDPPKIGDAKKIPENLSRYITFLHPWMNEILNQAVLMLMFFMLVIFTLIVLRLQDIG
jgi:ABC transport system ATP-binding/permease protein